MKKILPYLIAIIVILLLGWVVYSTKNANHVFDDRFSFNRRDKIPYGFYLAYKNLPRIFPGASVVVNRKAPTLWDSLNSYSGKQTLIIIVPSFRADELEMKRLLDFVKNGNNVFISAAIVSYEVQTMLHCEIPDEHFTFDNLSLNKNPDSFAVSLASPPFSKQDEYGCPGRRLESYFSKFDSETSIVFGNDMNVLPDLVQLKAGKGNLFFHLAPLAFSNYFLLYDKNINYYNKTLSLLPSDTKKVVWDEYFLNKRFSNRDESKSPLSALMSQRSFRAALWLLIILLCVYILQEMRRKQRIIPFMPRPRNDSLEFVKTIGRLYYEKGDNKNLAGKMAAYFLEHVRNRYKLTTNELDDEFVTALQRKTGQPENNIRKIISFIQDMDKPDVISDEQLADFHKELEEFYKTS
ncbi:MAG TPA: DUF4350 domain-containing protein [Chitinophagaceae bacterium]